MYSIKPIVEEIHNIYEQGKAEGRAEAIDAFISEVRKHHYLLSDRINSTDYGMFTFGIEQIAEELKEQK